MMLLMNSIVKVPMTCTVQSVKNSVYDEKIGNEHASVFPVRDFPCKTVVYQIPRQDVVEHVSMPVSQRSFLDFDGKCAPIGKKRRERIQSKINERG